MILGFIRRNWKFYIPGIVALILVDLGQLMIPKIVGKAADLIESGDFHMESLRIFIWWIIGLASGIFTGRFLWRRFIIGSARKFENFVLKVLFRKLLQLDPSFYNSMNRGEIMSRFTNDVPAVRRMLGGGIVISTDALFMSVMAITFMGRGISWHLTWIVLIPLLSISVLVVFFGRIIHRTFAEVQESFSKLSGFTEESVSAARVIKSFARIDKFGDMFKMRAWRNLKARMKLVLVTGAFWPMVRTIGMISGFLALMFGGKMVVNGNITIGEFVAFNAYLGMLVWPMTAFGWVVNLIQQGTASLKRINKILSSQPKIVDPVNPVEVKKIETLNVENLNFSYPGLERLVLKNVNLGVEHGRFIGIVGTVGSGKSTIAKLMLKFYPVERGRIYVNDFDINDVGTRSLRRRIAYVPQEGFLFSDTIRRNITLGEDINDDEIWRALELAGIKEEIEKLEMKLDTVVGERGLTLSGGQRQRVMIARALVRDVDVYLFDDCLSAVDPETEEKIIASLRETLKDKTLIVITHRLKVLQTADWIYVFDSGEIVEEGTHEQLMARRGLYHEMFIQQTVEVKV